jgi:hypothetical protein
MAYQTTRGEFSIAPPEKSVPVDFVADYEFGKLPVFLPCRKGAAPPHPKKSLPFVDYAGDAFHFQLTKN